MREVDIVIIGGGSAGMAAAIAAKQNGAESILVLEREIEMGGILEQCIHNGFGLQIFKEELTGPAFAERLFDELNELKIEYQTEATVLSINENKEVEYVSPKLGYVKLKAKAIILACGCYERSRGAISLPGKRLKGVYTAGAAQKYLNLEDILVGKRVFILGSGDIGLIMARRMTLEGAKVLGVAELMPYSNGLMRNVVQCLEDYNIPLYLSHTVKNIDGQDHVEKITIAEVDENKQFIEGTEKDFEVDTLLLSVGLIPESGLAQNMGLKLDPRTKGPIVNELLETSIPGIFACGNALHVHDLVDFVNMEARDAGKNAAIYIKDSESPKNYIDCFAGENVGYILPQRLNLNTNDNVIMSFRVRKPMKASIVEFMDGDKVIKAIKKRYLLPSEMERITLRNNEIKEINHSLTVRVREG